jgi:hypothetical protein
MEERDASPRLVGVRDEKERKDKRIERNKIQKGCNVIVAGVR